MKKGNIIFIVLFSLIIITGLIMCTGGEPAYITGEFIPFEYPVPEGMITDEAEKEAMIEAKISNLEATNKVFWGELPADPDTLPVLFQDIWGFIRTNFAGFKGIIKSEENPDGIDWDAYGDYVYEEIQYVDNYGDFARYATYMAYVLEEGHANISTGRLSGGRRTTPFRPHVPIFNTDVVSRIGACYTVTPDEELVVTYVIDKEENPYNLEPGDEIVGFNGIPWTEWYPRLLESGIPINGSPASSKGARRFNLLRSGMTNVNLFEKINILRYKTGEIETLDIVHLPFNWIDYNPCVDYIGDVPGVNPPKISAYRNFKDVLTTGIISGTNIGYLYLTGCPSGFDDFEDPAYWDPYKTEFSGEFNLAIIEMLETDGLIIDLRYNTGGKADPLYKGIAKLVENPEDFDIFTRVRRDTQDVDILALEEIVGQRSVFKGEDPDTNYDKPIVVLTGPDCISACDFLVATLAKFPDFTIIGWDNNGSFTGVAGETYKFGDDTISRYIPLNAGAYYDEEQVENEEFELLLRRSDFVQTKIWHNKEDIAKGIDTVREYALNLIKEQIAD
jgi:hypothetical protein